MDTKENTENTENTAEEILEEVKKFKDVGMELLKDALSDARAESKKKNFVIIGLIIAFLVSIMSMSFYHQDVLRKMADTHETRLIEFLSEYDFEVIRVEQTIGNENQEITQIANPPGEEVE